MRKDVGELRKSVDELHAECMHTTRSGLCIGPINRT
jgi:hypothetical protein